MNYIVNPWLLYLINVLGNIRDFAWAGILISAIAFAILVYIYYDLLTDANMYKKVADDDEYSDEWRDKNRKNVAKIEKDLAKIFNKVRISLILLVIFVLLEILIPSKETMYQMLLASYSTTDNVQMVLEATKNVADYIVSVLK